MNLLDDPLERGVPVLIVQGDGGQPSLRFDHPQQQRYHLLEALSLYRLSVLYYPDHTYMRQDCSRVNCTFKDLVVSEVFGSDSSLG